MDPNQNRPQGRRKNVTSGGNGAHRRGDGLGTGPVGSGSYSGGSTGGGGGAKRAAVGGGGLGVLSGLQRGQSYWSDAGIVRGLRGSQSDDRPPSESADGHGADDFTP